MRYLDIRRGLAGAMVLGGMLVLAFAVAMWAQRGTSASELHQEDGADERGIMTSSTEEEAVRTVTSTSTITNDEHEAAITDTIACMEDSGLEVEVIPSRGLRPTFFGYNVPVDNPADPGTALSDAHAAAGACRASFLNDVEAAWQRQRPEPTAEQIDALFNFMETCAANGGAPGEVQDENIGASRYGRDLRISDENMVHYAPCALAAYAETGLKPPVPPGAP